MNGGYIMVDVTGLDVSQGEQNIPGLYAKLEAAVSTGKPIMLVGAKNNEGEISPSFVTVTEGAGMAFTIGAFTAVVSNDDAITPVEA